MQESGGGMSVVAVIQARLSSSRLPAKVLLPMAGLPMVVLAAQRAANTGIEVVVATSTDPSDDPVADTVAAHGLRCVRGPLDDTLGRFVLAVERHADSDILIRLTADNVLPDGHLLDEMVADFQTRRLEYLICAAGSSGLPYGVSAEVLRVGTLRWADQSTGDPYDREHVTPYVARSHGAAPFEQYRSRRLDCQRSTVDQLDDYTRLAALFAKVQSPLSVGVLELAERLAMLPGAATVSRPLRDLVIGTAQFGLPYGVANTSGQPDLAEARDLVHTALRNGVQYIDTARAYGTSEGLIGAVLTQGWESRATVITKLSPLDGASPTLSGDMVDLLVDQSILQSCRQLRRQTLDTVLLHRAGHLSGWGGAAWRRLRELRDQEVVRSLGVSVQTPDELVSALGRTDVSHVQLPFNLLDWRWDAGLRRLEEVKGSREVTVHARSPLLQGLLTSGRPDLWNKAGVTDGGGVHAWLDHTTESLGRRSIPDLAFAFVRAQPWCDGVVVGMETVAQLNENMACFDTAPLTPDQIGYIRRERPTLDARSLDPATWRRER